MSFNILKSDIYNFSNPYIVQGKAFNLLGLDAFIYPSSKPTKKYMILRSAFIDNNGEYHNDKWIHFGEMYSEDYTYHNDEERLRRFRRRNRRWANQEIYTPGWLSYHLLW